MKKINYNNMVDVKKIKKDAKILVIGELILEIRITGKLNRILESDIIPVVDFQSLENVIGGLTIGTVSLLKKSGYDSKLISYIGPGKEGDIVSNKIKRSQLKSDLIVFDDKVTLTDLKIVHENGRILSLVEKRNKISFNNEQTELFLNKVNDSINEDNIDVIVYINSNLIPPIKSQLLDLISGKEIEFIEG